tara:strand:- start:677 stop:1666 length:990 start_codon:yes stop_codon:yes gene_type:complete
MKIAKSQLELVILEEAELLIVESFLDKVKEKLPSREDVADFFDQLGRTFKKINKGREILVKLSNEESITEEESELLMTAIRDMAKIIPMAGLIAMPGSPITIPFVVKLAKKYNIDIFPSEFSSEDDEIENKPRHADYEMDGNLAKGSFKLTETNLRKIVREERDFILFEDVGKEIEHSVKKIDEGLISAAALAALAAKAAALPLGIGMPIATALGPIVFLLKLLSWVVLGAQALGATAALVAAYKFIKFIYTKIMDDREPSDKEIDRILSNLKNKEDREKLATLIRDKLSDSEKREMFGQEAKSFVDKIKNLFKRKSKESEEEIEIEVT